MQPEAVSVEYVFATGRAAYPGKLSTRQTVVKGWNTQNLPLRQNLFPRRTLDTLADIKIRWFVSKP